MAFDYREGCRRELNTFFFIFSIQQYLDLNLPKNIKEKISNIAYKSCA
jgi:hypothetical protein